jgi:phage tail-like protein
MTETVRTLSSTPPANSLTVQVSSGAAPVSLSHVAERARMYPGETLSFFTRVDVVQALPGLTVQISLPLEFTLGEYSTSTLHESDVVDIVLTDDGRYLVWRLGRAVNAGERIEYEVKTVAPHTTEDLQLESTAMVLVESENDRTQMTATAEVRVVAKGRYLKYLPALYNDDELMGRFLMLFESFWQPIENQIDNIFYYFDPKMTPVDFLPWLATWSDLSLDERWTEAQQRLLLDSAARLYRMRGTKEGLVEFLEIYTGRRAVITEHRANNLRLGKEARFGASVAVGRANRPHSFSVSLRLPPIVAAEGEDELSRQRREQDRKRMIITIIESEKPAHTTYSLFLEEEQ